MTITIRDSGHSGLMMRGKTALTYRTYWVIGGLDTVWAHRDGTRYRLDTVYVASDGNVTTWSARQTKRDMHDFKNGIGINESLSFLDGLDPIVTARLMTALREAGALRQVRRTFDGATGVVVAVKDRERASAGNPHEVFEHRDVALLVALDNASLHAGCIGAWSPSDQVVDA